MDGEEPFIQVYVGYGGYAVREPGGLHFTSDIDHVAQLVVANLLECDEQDHTSVQQEVRHWWKRRANNQPRKTGE